MCILFDFIFPQKCAKYISTYVPPFTESNSAANIGDFISKLMFEYLIMYWSHKLSLWKIYLNGTSGDFCTIWYSFLTLGYIGVLYAESISKLGIYSNFSSRVKDRFKLTQALVVDPLYLQHSYSESAIDYRVSLYIFSFFFNSK